MFLPESQITQEALDRAKAAFEGMSDSELLEQEISLRNLIDEIPARQGRLADEHEQCLAAIRSSVLLEPLKGKLGTDMGELEQKQRELAAARTQARVDLERAQVLHRLCIQTQNYRRNHTRYLAVSTRHDDLKEELARAIPATADALANLISLHCLVSGGIKPIEVIPEKFVLAKLGDIRAHAIKVYEAQVSSLIEDWHNGGSAQYDLQQAGAAQVAAGREAVAEKYEAFQERAGSKNKSIKDIIRD